jgi:hypothetical protein
MEMLILFFISHSVTYSVAYSIWHERIQEEDDAHILKYHTIWPKYSWI